MFNTWNLGQQLLHRCRDLTRNLLSAESGGLDQHLDHGHDNLWFFFTRGEPQSCDTGCNRQYKNCQRHTATQGRSHHAVKHVHLSFTSLLVKPDWHKAILPCCMSHTPLVLSLSDTLHDIIKCQEIAWIYISERLSGRRESARAAACLNWTGKAKLLSGKCPSCPQSPHWTMIPTPAVTYVAAGGSG